jgi:hypothetical protein
MWQGGTSHLDQIDACGDPPGGASRLLHFRPLAPHIKGGKGAGNQSPSDN